MADKTILEMYGPRKKKGEVGIEIEVEGNNLPTGDLPEKWNVTRDGSLRGHGFEYVLRNPCSRGSVANNLNELKSVFDKTGAVVNDSPRAGVHIHVNCQDLTYREVYNIITLYLVFEKLLINYCGETRKGNLFCLSAEDAEALIFTLIQDVNRLTLSGVINDEYRYAAMNLAAIGKYGSIEFRSLQTPVDIMDIWRWVQILLCIKDKALEIEYPRDIVEAMSADGPEAYMEAVFGDLSRFLDCPEAGRWLTEGARRIQFFAYEATAVLERYKEKKKSSKKPGDWKIWGLPHGNPRIGQLLDMTGTYHQYVGDPDRWILVDKEAFMDAARDQGHGDYIPKEDRVDRGAPQNVQPVDQPRADNIEEALRNIRARIRHGDAPEWREDEGDF